MLKFVDKFSGEEDTFLYPKFIPRMGDTILKGGEYYKVDEVIFDDDEGDIIVNVIADATRTSSEKLINQVPNAVLEEVKSLLRDGSKLTAVKLLKQAARIGLKDAKDYCDELQDKLRETITVSVNKG